MTLDANDERARLLARERLHRRELRDAAQRLGRPFGWLTRARTTLRRAMPLLPYAAVLVTAVAITAQLRRGRLRPVVMIATAVDLWRLWTLLSGDDAPGRQALTHRSVPR